MSGIKCFWFAVIFLIPAVSWAVPECNLSVEVDIENSRITGTAEVIPDDNQELIFNTKNLNILDINRKAEFNRINEVNLYGKKNEPVRIKYEGIFKGPLNVINNDGVFLTDVWYPSLDVLCDYNLTAKLPEGFEAVSEAEDIKRIREKGYVTYNFNFPHPLESLHLIASDRFAVTREKHRDIYVYSYFFKEDNHLAKNYIEYARKYIDMYENLIGEFPYKRFAIVENVLPTGYSMPTFTLLGQSVVRLPFIVETSLGHEILHQWLGNYVYIDFEKGNWAEGLTTYLADHLYEELKGNGWQYRKNILVDYRSYVGPEGDFPLTEFQGRFDNSSKAIGYGKSAMLFHLLKNTIGEQNFYRAIKSFVHKNRFKRAGWAEIKTAFEESYKGDLNWFFNQWLNRKGLPHLKVENADLMVRGGKFNLTFDIVQKPDKYRLDLPVSFYYSDGRRKQENLKVSKERESFSFYLEDEPLKIILDENYDIPRELSGPELPPVISRLLGEEKIVFVLPEDKEDKYESMIKSFRGKGITTKTPEEIEYVDIRSNSLLIFDKENPVIGRLYGELSVHDAGFSIVVRENPWNEEKVVAVVHGKSKEEVGVSYRKIFHYGKYSALAFKSGNNVYKNRAEPDRGIIVEIREPAEAVHIPSMVNLETIVKDIRDKKIIYVGEQHDQFAHHMNQLAIIKGLYGINKKLAIGMEVFQRPFEKVIDDYINGKINEREFLKRTEYFKRWGLDYNLYKPIVDFAKENRIPIIALNIDREITRKVSQNGIGNLTEKEKELLPSQMDFSDKSYRERLKEVFGGHNSLGQGNFDFFFQAQVIWDEVMAESIDRFLNDNPGYQVVVLAGSGHIRYGSGIPKRVFRRNGYEYSIILNDEDIEKGVGDYVIYSENLEGTTSPELGVFLAGDKGMVRVSGFTEVSAAKKAGLREGDVILSFDGYNIRSVEELKVALFYKEKGDRAKIKVLRNGVKEQTLEIKF